MDILSPPQFGLAIALFLLLLIFLRVPIAFALITTSVIGLLFISDSRVLIHALRTIPFARIATWTLLPIPLFIIMGHFAFAAGIAEKAFGTATKWLGWLPGGLGIATIGACSLFAACSGSSVATAGTMGRTALPEMLKNNYDKRLATGIIASGGLLGIMIPPSIVMVIYGIATEQSIPLLLLAGVFPGLLTAFLFSLCILILLTIKPDLGPGRTTATWKSRLNSVKDIWGIFALAGIIMGGIYTGVFTASEAAAVGALFSLVLALLKGRKAFPAIVEGFKGTTVTSSMIFFLILGGGLLAFTISMGGVPQWSVEKIAMLHVPRIVILTIIIGIYFVLGLFVDTISMMLITLPVVFPVVLALGYDPIWFGVLIVKFNELGMITPPFGINVYVIKGVAPPDITLEDIFRGTMPFLLAELVSLAILIAFPGISLWLPYAMKG